VGVRLVFNAKGLLPENLHFKMPVITASEAGTGDEANADGTGTQTNVGLTHAPI